MKSVAIVALFVCLLQICGAQNATLGHEQKTAPIPRLQAQATTAAELLKNWHQFVSDPGLKRLRKTALSSDKRLFFVAGLEGTGHHAMKAVMQPCMSGRGCHAASNLTNAFFKVDKRAQQMHGLFSANDMGKVEELLDEALQALLVLSAAPGPAVHIIGLAFTPLAGMMSYPNFDVEGKVFHHPDLLVMAMLAESVGLDLRILVLQRSAEAVLASTKRRRFGGKHEEKILVENAGSLFTELHALDPLFYRCADYEDLHLFSTAQQEHLADFIHPMLRPLIAEMLSKVVPSNLTASEERGYFASQLKGRLRLIDGICESRHSHS